MILKYKRIAILGFGIEGKDIAKYLIKKGAKVTVRDIEKKKELDLEGFEKLNFICGENYLEGLDKYDIVFRSPGIYRYKKEIVDAEKKGVIISSATKLFFDRCKGKIIGITGTKGKGTTATLIYQSMVNDKKKAFLLGNIGEPFLEKLDDIGENSWIVMELSSFQLIDLNKSPHIAVVLNITEDHLDWHKDVKEYIESKKNIIAYQEENDFAVISHDYEASRSFSKIGKGKKYYFSKKKRVKGCFVEDGKDIKVSIDGHEEEIASTNDLILKGSHIVENVTASVCVSYLAGVTPSSIRKAITEFRGYEHRMEYVDNIDGIIFYNDSAATGPHSSMAAVESFGEPITLILGGFDKGLSYENFTQNISKKRNVENVILIGDISGKLEKLFKDSKYEGNLVNLGDSSMRKIVRKAKEMTEKGGIVLLSPAASSFDMFDSYKDRGKKFKDEIGVFKIK